MRNIVKFSNQSIQIIYIYIYIYVYYLYIIIILTILIGRVLTADWSCDCCGTLRKKGPKDFWESNPKKGSPPKV